MSYQRYDNLLVWIKLGQLHHAMMGNAASADITGTLVNQAARVGHREDNIVFIHRNSTAFSLLRQSQFSCYGSNHEYFAASVKMKPQTSSDVKFEAFYSQSNSAPRWFSVALHIFYNTVKAGGLYCLAKFISIEAALIAYVLLSGIRQGIDGHSESRDMNRLLLNDRELEKRIRALEALKSGH